ncbi:hypothetical protein BS17DRAFT_778339 [Gyrodon lividus]|nr:hypothetical protein BS17DRAFT_778339 [Gyrodon lividus]
MWLPDPYHFGTSAEQGAHAFPIIWAVFLFSGIRLDTDFISNATRDVKTSTPPTICCLSGCDRS